MSRPDILLAVWNGADYLPQQLDSILRQDMQDWQLILSDDASTDASADILAAYAQRHPERIMLRRAEKPFGSAKAHFLHLMRQCDAPYAFFCDQDDVWHADKLRLTMDALQQAEAESGTDMPVLVFTDLRLVDEALQPIASSLTRYQHRPVDDLDYRSLLLQNVVNGCTIGCNRALMDLAGQCCDESAILMHDGWLAAVAARFGRIVYLDEATVDYRQHSGNSVGGVDVRSAGYVIKRLRALKQLKATIAAKKKQAAVFAATYHDRLNAEDRDFLTGFARQRSGLRFYLRHQKHLHSLYHRVGFVLFG